jgi:Tol biopolymer transport system component
MNPERWQRIEALYHGAFAQSPDRRQAFLAEACGPDDALQAEVQSLLDQSGLDTGWLARQTGELSPLDAPLNPGERLGHYEIRGLLGVGGMGEVYRAADQRLGREVAIKVLPHRVADDPDRLARFEREARMLASLNHPHIAAIYGIEDATAESGQPIRTLVLELVEGPTLADLLARGPLKVADATAVAMQIAEALEAAHEKGIVHRDVKPANIKIAPHGTVKVLDFGLAAPASAATVLPLTHVPTVGHHTEAGIVLGTLSYMSPEQARGLAVDKRADVWGFGCVLFEMLTGTRAFAGATRSDIVARIIEHEPDWSALPPAIPGGVARVLRWALVKDPQRRLRDLGDARLELELPDAAGDARGAAAPSRRGQIAALLGALVLGAVASGALARWWQPAAAESPRLTSRLAIPVGSRELLPRNVAISPDGRYVAYLAGPSGNEKTYLRSVGAPQARVIAELPLQSPQPFFSPDSRWVAYFDAGKLKKTPVDGGVAVTLAEAPTPRGGTWGADGTIVFAPISRGGLMWLPSDGGPAQALTTLDDARGETSHRQPAFIAQSRTVLFVVDGTSDRSVRVVSLDTKDVKAVRPGDALRPSYVPTGHLVYLVDGKLMASRFDARTLRLSGTPVTLVDGVDAFSFSDDGTLVYSGAPGSADGLTYSDAGGNNIRTSTLVWVGRKNNVTPLPLPPDHYEHPRLSADGSRIAVGRVDPEGRSVWLYDIARETLARLSAASSSDWPVWSADGTRVFYASNRAGTQFDIVSKPSDGSGPEEAILARPLTQIPRAASLTQSLIFEETYPDRPNALWQMSIGTGREPQPLLVTGEMMPTFSPDGRWIAYVSPQSGRQEILVRSSVGEGSRRQISNGGGVEPVWSSDGRELFYRADDKMMAVDVFQGTVPTFGKPRVLFEGSYVFGNTEGQAFDVSRDGRRFLMMRPQRPLAAVPLNVIVNWFDALRQLP